MQRRSFFKTAAMIAGSTALSALPPVHAMDCKKRPLQAIALCAIELPPEQFALQAKKAGYEKMGLRIHPIVPGALAHEFRANTPEIRAFKQHLANTGIVLHGVDGFAINSDTDPSQFHPLKYCSR